MDPAPLPPPSPSQSPPYPPQNPHTPTDAVIEADRFQKAEPSTSRNMNNFKALVFKLAGRFSPAQRSLIHRRFDDIVPDELLAPDHPPYADMILNALWELKEEGGSSEEDISNFIEKEYHELPWAHATILNHHIKDLCKKGKIIMTHDGCYMLFSSIEKSERSLSPSSCSSPVSSSYSPVSSSYSSTSTSFCSSPSSSSSSLSRDGSRQKKKNAKRRMAGKKVKVRSRDTGRGRSNRRGPGRGRGVGQRRKVNGRFDVEVRNEETEPEQETEDQNEVTSMEVEDYPVKDRGVVHDVIVVSEEENPPCERNNKEQSRPQKKYNVTWVGRRARKLEVDEVDFLNKLLDDEVKLLEDDVSNAKVDEHVEQPEPKEEKGATDMEMEYNGQEENPQSGIVKKTEESDKQVDLLTEEKVETKVQSANLHDVDDDDDDDVTDKQHGDTSEEQIVHAENKEECVKKTEESDKQVDLLSEEKVETKVQSADPHYDDDDDDVTDKQHGDTCEEQIEPEESKEECVEKTEESDNQVDLLTKERAETTAQSGNLHDDDDDDDVTEKQHGDTSEEQIEPAESKEECVKKTEEYDEQIDCLTKEPVESKAQSADLRDDDDDVTEEPINPQEKCVEKTEESLQSGSAGQEEQEIEVNEEETVSAEVQEEQMVEMIEQKIPPSVQQTEIPEKDSAQEETNPVRTDESTTSSGSTTEGSRRSLRQGLRSSSKKEDAAPKSNSKKQLDMVTPVRRSLRSNKATSEAAVEAEVPDDSKEQVTHSGRTRSSKRKPGIGIAEVEQGSSTRKTRRTGL